MAKPYGSVRVAAQQQRVTAASPDWQDVVHQSLSTNMARHVLHKLPRLHGHGLPYLSSVWYWHPESMLVNPEILIIAYIKCVRPILLEAVGN